MFDFMIRAEAQTRILNDLPSTSSAFEVGNIDVWYAVLSNFNYFALAFTIFYSAILYMNFWYWRLFHHRERLHHEAKGVKSIQDAWWLWGRYLICLILLTLALSSRIVFMRSLFTFLYLVTLLMWKIREDVIVICESLSQGFGQIAWKNDWPKKLAASLKHLRLGELKNFATHNPFKQFSFPIVFVILYSVFMFVAIIAMTVWSFIV